MNKSLLTRLMFRSIQIIIRIQVNSLKIIINLTMLPTIFIVGAVKYDKVASSIKL